VRRKGKSKGLKKNWKS